MLLTATIVTSGDVPIDTSELGLFTIFYDVTDTAGNTAVTKQRVVEVRERKKAAQNTPEMDFATIALFLM